MSRVGGPGKASPTTSALQPNSITPIELGVGGWRFTFALGAEPSTGELRDVAETVAHVTGVDRDSALAAVLSAVAIPVAVWEVAA
jgi:hypothetical protein